MGGRGPRVEAAKPDIIPLLAEGASELQQLGADAAPVVSAKRLLPDCLPCIIRQYPVVVEGCYESIQLRGGGLPWAVVI